MRVYTDIDSIRNIYVNIHFEWVKHPVENWRIFSFLRITPVTRKIPRSRCECNNCSIYQGLSKYAHSVPKVNVTLVVSNRISYIILLLNTYYKVWLGHHVNLLIYPLLSQTQTNTT